MAPKETFIQESVKQVLLVDNNKDLLDSLKVGLDKYSHAFTTVLANDGEQALEVLRDKPISVVVSDVKMPKMNGLSLLSNMTGQFPDIPVVIISAYGEDELAWLARKSGAVAFVSKPFSVNEIGSIILDLLKKESDGGVIKGISVGVFMQLAEMEEMTCTIRVYSGRNQSQGVVFFKRGTLLDARYSNFSGEPAIVKILQIDHAHLRIQNSCPDLIEANIHSGLQAMLLEAMRQKDERGEAGESAEVVTSQNGATGFSEPKIEQPKIEQVIDAPKSLPEKKTANPVAEDQNAEWVFKRIINEMGKGFGWRRLDSGPGWEQTVSLSLRVGAIFNAEGLKCGFIRRVDNRSNMIIPGSPPVVLQVDHTCPRDRIYRVVGRIA